MIQLSKAQRKILDIPTEEKIFLEGSAGVGKTTLAIERARAILADRLGLCKMLILTPAHSYSQPYFDAKIGTGMRPEISTYSSFVQRSLDLFWPWVAEAAGFEKPTEQPIFLSIEAAQILMAKLVEKKLEQGFFSQLSIPKSRIYNQMMVSLHKMASAGLSFESYAERMRKSWTGDSSLSVVFDQVQVCGDMFRQTCLANNFLDYSIQLDVFCNILLPLESYQSWLKWNYGHFIFENAEEDVPAAHVFARVMMRTCHSGLIIVDQDGGVRNFMGGDAVSAQSLKDECMHVETLEESFISSPAVRAMKQAVLDPMIPAERLPASPRPAFRFDAFHDYPSMIKRAAIDTADLIHRQNVPPSEIVIIAPVLSDVLYTSMERELRVNDVNVYLHRPSRPLNQENASKCMLVLSALLNPGWGVVPKMMDLVQMFQTFIPALDPIRGHILVSRTCKAVLNEMKEPQRYSLTPFAAVAEEYRQRITDQIGARYEVIRCWIEKNQNAAEPPDYLMEKFFNEVLTQDGFNISNELNIGIKKICESYQKFSLIADRADPTVLGWKDYFKCVDEGMVSARYNEEWFAQPDDAVLLTLASTYITMNRPAAYQIWLNAGSPRWWERFYSQITNDIVLSRSWPADGIWDAEMIYHHNDENMLRQVLRLLSVCRRQIRVFTSELNEAGQDQKSKLLYIFAELSYRFGRDKPLSDGKAAQFYIREEDTDGIYPGINEEEYHL